MDPGAGGYPKLGFRVLEVPWSNGFAERKYICHIWWFFEVDRAEGTQSITRGDSGYTEPSLDSLYKLLHINLSLQQLSTYILT